MANRSYLYMCHPGEMPMYRDVAEWADQVPLAHLLLVGVDTVVCPSAIWPVDVEIALEGHAAQSRPLFLAFLDWLAPQLPADFGEIAARVRTCLMRPDRQGASYHLEPGEIYELQGLDLKAMAGATVDLAVQARALVEEVRGLVTMEGGPRTLGDARDIRLRELRSHWDTDLGLDVADVLYMHLG